MISFKRYFFIVLFLAVYAHSMISGEMSSSGLSSSKSSSSSSSSSSEDGTYVLFNEGGNKIRDKIYYALKSAGNRADSGSLEIDIDAAYLTDHAFWKTMIPDLAKEGAKIDINCGINTYNNQAVSYLNKISAENPSLQIHQQSQHGKRVLIKYVDKETGESKSQVFEGSNNLSRAALGNYEAVSYTKNSKSYYDQAKKSHDSQFLKENGYNSPDEDKENEPLRVFKVTPEKKRHVDSNSHDLIGNVVYRIKNAQEGDELKLASMNFSHPDVFNATKKACERGVKTEIFINSSALNTKTSEDFQELKDLGAKVFVYPESKNGILHEKVCARISNPGKKDEKSVFVIGSRNYSEDTEKNEFNHQGIFPHAKYMTEQFEKHTKDLQEEGIVKPLTEKMIKYALLKKDENKKETKKYSKKNKSFKIDNYPKSPIHKKKKKKKSSLLNNSSVQRSLTFDKKI